MSTIHEVKCSTCKQVVARVEFVTDSVTLKCMSFHCDRCNYPINDVTWIDSVKRMQKEREESFDTMKKINGVKE